MDEIEQIVIDALTPQYRWAYFGRWWDCIYDNLYMNGVMETRRSLDVYELSGYCTAPTLEAARAIFLNNYPGIDIYEICCLGAVKPKPPKKRRKRKQ